MASSAPAPSLTRLRRPSWKDPRLLVGILLVLVSVVGGALLVRHLSETTVVLVARTEIAPGEVVESADLEPVEVRLGDTAGVYLDSAAEVPEGSTALRSLGRGELVPREAIGQPQQNALRIVSIPTDAALSAAIGPNTVVEIWSTPTPGPQERTVPATRVVQHAVVRTVTDSGSLALGDRVVDVLVEEDAVPAVLEAVAADGSIALVPVPAADGSTS